MEVNYNSVETRTGDNSDLIQDDFGKCKCGCNRVFLQKRTIIKLFKDFIKKYKHLPLDLNFFSMEGEKGFMQIGVRVEQTGNIKIKDLKVK